MKTHIYSLDILVQNVKIEIKFPCSINVAFKLGKQQAQTQESFKLENGQAFIEQTLRLKTNLSYNILSKNYAQRKGILTIHVVSSSGKNVAGILHLDIGKIFNESINGVEIDRTLERCPDKNAKIKMRISGKLIEETEHIQESNSANVSFYSNSVNQNRQGSVQSSYKRTSILQSSHTPNRPKFTSAQHYLQVGNSHSNHSGHSYGGFKTSRVERVEPFQSRTAYDSALILETSRRQEGEKSKTISQLRIDIVQKDRKITRLQIEKTSFQKQCDLLKIQITNQKNKYQSKANKQSELTFQNERLNKKIGILESALEAYKTKPEFRRMESFSTKFSSEELAHRSQRLDELELEYRNLKANKQQTQRVLREAKKESRQLYQKSEDLQNSLTTLNKRLQLKQTFYKDQLKKYNDKILQFESLKIELSNQNYFLKSQFDQSERKLNQSIKQKQKLLGEEKYRQNRKNQQVQNQIQSLNTQIQQLNAKVLKLTHDNQQLEFGIKQKIQQRTYFQQQIDRLNSILIQNQNISKQRHSNQLLIQRKQLQQKHKYRQQQLQQLIQSKMSELQNSNRIVLDKSQHVKAFNERLNETQKRIKEKQQKIVELNQSLETITKRLDLVKTNEDKLNNEMNQYKLNYNKLKIEFDRVDKQKRQLSEYNHQSKQHQNQLLVELKNIIKTLTQELEFGKNTNRILEEQKIELVNQNRKLEQKSLNLTLNLNQISEKQGRQTEELNKKKQLIRQLQNENQKIKVIISQQKQMLDEQSIRSNSLQTKIIKLEQQSQQISFLNDHIKRLEATNKEKETELKSKLQNQTSLQVNIQKQEYEIQALKDQLKIRVNEVQNEKYVSESVRKQINMIKQQSDIVKKDNHIKFEEISRLQYENNKLHNDLKNTTDKYYLSLQDLKKYKQKCFNSFLKFFNSMSEDPHVPFNASNIELDDLIHSAHIKLKSIREFNERQVNGRIESLRTEMSRIKTEAEDMEKEKEQYNIDLYRQNQSIEENFKFYKESVRLKELETEEEVANLTEKLREYAEELNHQISQKQEVSLKYHQQLIKSQQLSVYLEQAQREINRIVEQKNSIIQQLQQQKKNHIDYLKRINEEGSMQFEQRQRKLKSQLNQLQRSDKQKKKTIETLQSQIRNHNRQIEQKMEILRITEKNNEDLRKQIDIINNQSQSNFKKQKQLHEKVRSLEQSMVLTEQRQSQSSIFNQLRDKQLEDLKYHFEKQKHQLVKKLTQAENDLKNSEVNCEIKFNSLTQENLFLKERVAKSSKYTDQEYRKKDEEIVSLTKDILFKRNQLNTLQNQFNQYKRQAENGARLVRDELQKSLFSVDHLEKKLGSMGNQLKFMEDKCSSLEAEKRKIFQDVGKTKQISTGDYQNLRQQNQRIRAQISQLGNKYGLEIVQLKKCKQGLLSQIQQLIIRHKQKSRETAEYYDREIRQMTARMVSIQNDADQKVKRANRQKYQDRAALEFEIQCLRQELSKYTEVRVQRNTQSRNEFISQSSQAKMKLFLSEEPLRNIESWIPSLINQVKQYQQTIYTHQKQIKQLQGQLDSTTKMVQSHLSSGRSVRTSRKSSFFPQSIVNQTFKDGSSFIQKLQQILINVQIALRKVQDLAFQLESVTQDKCILLTKARQVYGGLVQGKIDYSKNELASILDYSKVEAGSFYVRVSKPN